MQTEIILSTINARYMHTAFGLRYLYANMGELQPQTQILEFVLGKNPRDIVENILQHNPKIVGFGVYIWNTEEILETITILKRVAPHIQIVLGGPEVSYEIEGQRLFAVADYVVKGEAEFLFRDLCRTLLAGQQPETKTPKWIAGALPTITELKLPYEYYTDHDIAHRVLYVEASRGCPYKCEYCLSSLDVSVRNFAVDEFLQQMQMLIDRGARQFKFVDRTFNLSPTISTKILQFFLDRIQLGLFLHFEMVPDRLPDDLKKLIARFPAGALQFEIGVQTWTPSVAANVSRRQNYEKIVENFKYLREHTGVHTHADLIVGLPGETAETFAAGFDALAACGPDEIQVGILKRLKGTPIVRHDQKFSMVYSAHTPFQLLSNKDMSFQSMQNFGRFAQFWDLVANSGNFPRVMTFLRTKIPQFDNSLFALMWDLSEFLFAKHGQAHAISRNNLSESLVTYLEQRFQMAKTEAQALVAPAKKLATSPVPLPERQQKHLSL